MPRDRKLFTGVMLVLLILSQDVTWIGIKALLASVLRVSIEEYSTAFFMIQGYCGFVYLFTTTAAVEDSRRTATEILDRPGSRTALRILDAGWYGLQYCFEKFGEGQNSEAGDNLKDHLNEIHRMSPGVQLIPAFGFVFVITLLLYFFSSDEVRSVITGLFSLCSALAGFLLFAHGLKKMNRDEKK